MVRKLFKISISHTIVSRLSRLAILLVLLTNSTIYTNLSNAPAFALSLKIKPKSKEIPFKTKVFFPSCDFKSNALSPAALELAKELDLIQPLAQMAELRRQIQLLAGTKAPIDLREDLRDTKQEIIEKIEQTRLEIDYVQAALTAEIAIQNELLQAYSAMRDKRMNDAYLWSFRTNGVLWAAAEGLAIPTYSHPHYSVPSGTLGIIAGLVPSVFSMIALRESSGGHYTREAHPNMLSKVFNYPAPSEMEYPPSVWNYLQAVPPNSTDKKTRLEKLIDIWVEDKNIHGLTDKNSKKDLDILTGAVENHLTLQLIADRAAMLQQLSAVISMMNRPLLELMLAVRDQKSICCQQ